MSLEQLHSHVVAIAKLCLPKDVIKYMLFIL